MATYQYIIDDFNDNSIDSTKWIIGTGSTLQNESGGRLNTPVAAAASPTFIISTPMHDLRKGRLAIKLSKSGTTDANVYTYFGLKDNANHFYTLFGRSTDASLSAAANDAGTGTATNVDTTVGVGPSWVANTWLGWSYDEATKTYSLSKSTDGVNWTQIHKYVVTTSGTFDFKHAGLFLGATSYGTVTNFTPSWEDASYFATDTNLKVRVRYGGAWVYASPKVRYGGVWKRPIGKVRNGGLWVRPQ